MKKKRDYKKENERTKEKNIRVNMKIPKKHEYTLEQIKENEGLTKFFIKGVKNYERKELILTAGETANLMAIVENFVMRNSNLDSSYLKEIKELEKKIKSYYDDIFS